MTELSELAREVETHERTLRRAINDGTLRAARATPRTLRMAMSERQYIRRTWPLIAALKAVLRTEHNVRFAMLYGSVARGDDSATSDVDVLVELRDASLDAVVDLAAKLSAHIDWRVDVVRLEDAESDPRFLSDVVGDGRVLVDRAGRWSQLQRRAARRHDRDADRVSAALSGIDRLLASSDG